MKKRLSIILWLIAAGGIIAIFLTFLQFQRLSNGYHDTIIVTNGPFHSQIPSLYPDTREKKEEIERWFLHAIPPGTPRDEARRVLSKSFSSDLTSGKEISIDRYGDLSGGASTSVTIHFDGQGRVRSVEVKQHWSFL